MRQIGLCLSVLLLFRREPPSGVNTGFVPSGINAGFVFPPSGLRPPSPASGGRDSFRTRFRIWRAPSGINAGSVKRDKTWVRAKRCKYGLRRAMRHSLPFIGNAVQRLQYPFIQPLALVQDVCFYHHADVQRLFFTVNVDAGFIRLDAHQIGRLVQQRGIAEYHAQPAQFLLAQRRLCNIVE